MNKTITLMLASMVAMAVMAGCGSNGKNGSTGSTGPGGPSGPQGTPGPTLPTVTYVSPGQGATGVYMDTVIKAAFSKQISTTTINTSTFSITTASGVPVTGTISYNAGSQTAFFDPAVPLYAFSFYTATLGTGIKDLAGNPLTAVYTWSFSTGGSTTPSELYVANAAANTISVFNSASAANGNSAPDRTISNASFSHSWRIWLDKASDRLYVANRDAGNILIFDNASFITGTVTPARTLSGSLFTRPGGMWLDSAHDTLYMADYTSNAIDVFNNISTLNGTVTPDRIIWGANTGLNYPEFLWLDGQTNSLYVTNFGANSIVVFSNASTINGNIAPSRTITSSDFTGPAGIWLDTASNQLYVTETGTIGLPLLIFDNASTLSGSVTPSRMVYGSNTTFNDPYGLWLDTADDRLYIADFGNGSVDVFDNASTINGNIAPTRIIEGSNTGLNMPESIWLDMNP